MHGMYQTYKDVGPTLRASLANVELHGAESVDGETLVRVDGDTEETRVGVDELILVPNDGVPQDASIIEVCQTRHVIRAVKLGGIDLANLIFLEHFFLQL